MAIQLKKFNHNKNILKEQSASKGKIEPGHIVTFSYSGKEVNTPRPMVLVLHPNYMGKMHALNIEYIPEAVLKQLWNITKVTLQGKIEKLAKLRLPLLKADIGNPQSFYNSRLKGFLKGALGSTNVCYRTYSAGGIGGVKIVDYRFQDSAWEQEQRQKAEDLKNKKK